MAVEIKRLEALKKLEAGLLGLWNMTQKDANAAAARDGC